MLLLGDHLLGAHLLVRGSPSSARARLGATEPGQRSAPGEDEVAALSCHLAVSGATPPPPPTLGLSLALAEVRRLPRWLERWRGRRAGAGAWGVHEDVGEKWILLASAQKPSQLPHRDIYDCNRRWGGRRGMARG